MCVKGNLTSMHQSGLLSCFFKGWDLGLPWQFPGGDNGKESACQCRRCEFDPWVGKIPWRRKWQPLQDSCLENPMDRGAWRATVQGVAKSQTRLSN